MARRLEAGAVNINDAMVNGFSFAVPMPGWKHSGIGARNGGADGHTEILPPTSDHAPRVPTQSHELLWYPYSRRKFRISMGLLRASGGTRPATGRPQAAGRCTMKCQAAVLRGVGQDWEIEEITLDPPHDGEVLVKMAVAGVCHSDDHYATGDSVPSPELAAIDGGHRWVGAGVFPAARWARRRGRRRGGGPGRAVGAARRPRRHLLHPRVRFLSVVRVRHDLPVRRRRDDVRQGDDDRRHRAGVTSATRI